MQSDNASETDAGTPDDTGHTMEWTVERDGSGGGYLQQMSGLDYVSVFFLFSV